ncbi:MAG TPA: putative baseplate assembly protein [Candidatus Udaeobacter sp.]|nr:putative baseplate assembly protein [Candidatus Udaeobacter sp.]
MSLCCQQDDRRDAVRRAKELNGLDYIEVSNDQLTLTAFFLGKLPPELSEEKPGLEKFLQLEGGQRVTDIQITRVKPVSDPDSETDDQLVITLDKYGDFSTYTLGLAGVKNIDPRYDHVDFNFKINCPSDLDCAPVCKCEPQPLPEPEINYLAKDYASFRQLILDRLALLVPDWTERHVPDVGIALVELLAYTGDYLSYFQDAVATEAYLDTARQRISVRRHARLVDYKLSEGCNARAWICIQSDSDLALDPRDASFTTGFDDPQLTGKIILNRDDLRSVPARAYEVFEAMPLESEAQIQVYAAHSEIHFYTWGEKECCLERGSTSATLVDGSTEPAAQISADQPELKIHSPRKQKLQLKPGDVLIFEEVLAPITGNPADADPSHRHAVRLTKVTPGEDALYKQPLVEIEWAAEDALPFPFCLSAIGEAPECKYLENISVARGNAILVDHGKTVGPEDLGQVPTLRTQATCECADHPGDIQTVAGLFRPSLSKTPLTFRESLAADEPAKYQWTPAASLLTQDVRAALPQVQLNSQPTQQWSARYDVIESEPEDRQFVAEIDNGGIAHLRFGDGELGFQPPAGMTFSATYRAGNGTSGNVGAETISCLVLSKTTLSGASITVRNPLPAQGGTDAEPMAEAKLFAPHAFRDPKQIQRAIIAADYELIAERNAKVQNASAALVWTGSWYEADVAIDPFGREDADASLLASLAAYLEEFRRMGHDLRVMPACYVPLDLKLEVCALAHYQRAHVKAALIEFFSNRILPGGVRGFFHPDNVTFGEGVFLSKIIATAQAVPGVQSVAVTRFQRLFESANREIENGVLPLRVNEIAQLDRDPNYPEHGKLEIQVKGGR